MFTSRGIYQTTSWDLSLINHPCCLGYKAEWDICCYKTTQMLNSRADFVARASAGDNARLCLGRRMHARVQLPVIYTVHGRSSDFLYSLFFVFNYESMCLTPPPPPPPKWSREYWTGNDLPLATLIGTHMRLGRFFDTWMGCVSLICAV